MPKQKHKRGNPRRDHEARSKSKQPRLKTPLRPTLEQRLENLNRAYEHAITDATCDELDEIAKTSLLWASELAAVHMPEVPDDMIETGRIVFPQEPAIRVFDLVAHFHANNLHLTPDEVVAFIEQRVYGQAASIGN